MPTFCFYVWKSVRLFHLRILTTRNLRRKCSACWIGKIVSFSLHSSTLSNLTGQKANAICLRTISNCIEVISGIWIRVGSCFLIAVGRGHHLGPLTLSTYERSPVLQFVYVPFSVLLIRSLSTIWTEKVRLAFGFVLISVENSGIGAWAFILPHYLQINV